jgi:membrane protein implicated in regulation of membrane protease activity
VRAYLPDLAVAALLLAAWGLLTAGLAAYLDARVWWLSGAALCTASALAIYGIVPASAVLWRGLLHWMQHEQQQNGSREREQGGKGRAA